MQSENHLQAYTARVICWRDGTKDTTSPTVHLAPVVQRLDNAIHRINHNPVDKC